MHNYKILYIFFLSFVFLGQSVTCQKIEAAYSVWDNQFDEWNIHVNEELYVHAIRQFGANTYSRWNLVYEDDEGLHRGFMQSKRAEDFNYFDFYIGNEQLMITTVYANNPTIWKIQHYDKTLIIQNRGPFEWSKRSSREFEWNMYQVNEGFIHDWYIDDNSQDEITFEMRVAATLIVLETVAFM
jgi:hypothetical protein